MGVGQAQGSSIFWILTALGEGTDSGSLLFDWMSGGGSADPEICVLRMASVGVKFLRRLSSFCSSRLNYDSEPPYFDAIE